MKLRVFVVFMLLAALMSVLAGCGANEEEVRAAASIARAGEGTRYDVGILETGSEAASKRLPAVIDAEQKRREYLHDLADISAEVLCNQLATMLDTRQFPSVSEWEEALTSSIVDARLEVPQEMHAWTEAIVGGTYNYLAGDDGVIDSSDVSNAQANLC
jgi:hypothetical protein